jgi:hypothetical protein
MIRPLSDGVIYEGISPRRRHLRPKLVLFNVMKNNRHRSKEAKRVQILEVNPLNSHALT